MKRTIKILIAGIAAVMLASSCGTKTYLNIDYLQDVATDTTWTAGNTGGILIQPKDMISIVVSSKDPELSAMFNLPVASYQAGAEISSTSAGYQRLLAYVVDLDGNIDFPLLGQLKAAGMNRWELADMVKSELIGRGLLKDAVVSVEFMNFKISVMGEVTSPGTFTINGDKINILEALSLAKDMTIYGRRDNVTVVREQNGQRNIYHLDLRSADLFNSPAYYLQQNDIVYVYPNSVRAGQSTINENYFKSASFWMNVGSILITVANLVIAVSR